MESVYFEYVLSSHKEDESATPRRPQDEIIQRARSAGRRRASKFQRRIICCIEEQSPIRSARRRHRDRRYSCRCR
jgi:hypothetical protein